MATLIRIARQVERLVAKYPKQLPCVALEHEAFRFRTSRHRSLSNAGGLFGTTNNTLYRPKLF